MRGKDMCYRHSMSDEAWAALDVKGGKNRAAKHERMRYLPRAHQEPVLEVIAELVDSTIPGSSEPCIPDRALGVWLAATHFEVRDKRAALDILREIRPALATDPKLQRLIDFRAAEEGLREAAGVLRTLYRAGKIQAHELPPGILSADGVAAIGIP
jgi:hypothetical protein